MKSDTPSYHGYRFPPEIISHAVWLYHRFGVSFRDVEDLLAQRGITVSYEAIRLWCLTFGSAYARRLKRQQGRLGDIWHLDGVGARMRAGLRASNRRARHLPMRYETGLPSSVIRFRTLHASTASRRCPDELRARRQSPTIDVYRKNAFSTRAC